jgi:hypothetical protein
MDVTGSNKLTEGQPGNGIQHEGANNKLEENFSWKI